MDVLGKYECAFAQLLGDKAMSTLRSIAVNINLGDVILVGPRREPAEVTKIEYHERSGEISLNTTRGPRKMLTFCLPENVEKT